MLGSVKLLTNNQGGSKMYITGLLSRYSLMAARGESYPWITHPDLIGITNNILEIPDLKEISIIDLMSGTGHAGNAIKEFLNKMHRIVSRLTLLDFCHEMLEMASPKPDDTVCEDVLHNHLPAEGYHKAIVRLSLQDEPEVCQQRIFDEAYRLLIPGGQFILISHCSFPKNNITLNAVLSAADEARGISISPGRHIATLGKIITWLTSAGFLHPFIRHYFNSHIEYCEHEIPPEDRQKKWIALNHRLQREHLLEQAMHDLAITTNRPWYYEIPGVIISARK